jgi:predicted flap endonuclease-1-like 5' DNA nuclease
MANYKIEDLEGVGKVRGEKLRAAGIKDTDALLAACLTPKQRSELAAKAGVSPKRLLKWANMADLYRVSGIGSEFAELLEEAGVDTVPELAQRNAANLTAAMLAANEAKKLTRRVPSEAEVQKWIAQAKKLPRSLQY